MEDGTMVLLLIGLFLMGIWPLFGLFLVIISIPFPEQESIDNGGVRTK